MDASKYGMQSVLETNDLNEIMNMVSSVHLYLTCYVFVATLGVHCHALLRTRSPPGIQRSHLIRCTLTMTVF